MKKVTKKVKITILTGMHIGVGGDKAQIGGVDSPVIKDPVSNLPYIPGSSLKGKIRCLIETEANDKYKNGVNNVYVNQYFGATSEFLKLIEKPENKDKFKETSSRLIFRDFKLSEKDKTAYLSGKLQLEVKTEIKIDRTKGTTKDGMLRTIERVPPGTVFEGEILIKHNENTPNELERMEDMLNTGFSLLKGDFLGGSGSRGYGAVNIEFMS